MPTTNTATTRKPYYESVIEDAGLSPVTAEELQSKFDAITRSEYDQQRTDLQNATNQYYNQLYNTQNTAMDTIRQANAQAVATGASRGVQAANELSAILGLQSESATGAAELANQATALAQDETTAMLENVLNAETQAAEQNQALANILLQSGSVDVEGQNANTASQQVLMNYWTQYMQALANEDNSTAQAILTQMTDYSTNKNLSNTSNASNTAELARIQALPLPEFDINANDFALLDFGESGASKMERYKDSITSYVENLGLDSSEVTNDIDKIYEEINQDKRTKKSDRIRDALNAYVKNKQQEAINKHQTQGN